MMNALCFGVSAAAAGSSDLSKFFKSKIWPFLIDEDNISQTTKMTCPVTLSPTATETVSLTIMGGLIAALRVFGVGDVVETAVASRLVKQISLVNLRSRFVFIQAEPTARVVSS